jgi:hypothetical protein
MTRGIKVWLLAWVGTILICTAFALTLEPTQLKPLKAELNPICHLLALLGAHPIFHVSRIRVDIKWL